MCVCLAFNGGLLSLCVYYTHVESFFIERAAHSAVSRRRTRFVPTPGCPNLPLGRFKPSYDPGVDDELEAPDAIAACKLYKFYVLYICIVYMHQMLIDTPLFVR